MNKLLYLMRHDETIFNNLSKYKDPAIHLVLKKTKKKQTDLHY